MRTDDAGTRARLLTRDRSVFPSTSYGISFASSTRGGDAGVDLRDQNDLVLRVETANDDDEGRRRRRRAGRRVVGHALGVFALAVFALAVGYAGVRTSGGLNVQRRSAGFASLGDAGVDMNVDVDANDAGRLPRNFFGQPLTERARSEAPSKSSGRNRISLRTRVPELRAKPTREARLWKGGPTAVTKARARGVPGLSAHVLRAQRSSDDARILVLTKPFEWGMTYLQIASVKRWAPALLPHVTVLTYDKQTQASCEAHRGVDCFYDANFVRRYGEDTSDVKARDAMSWRKVHAALELLRARVPVVILDSDTVFLSDPTETWTDLLGKYDVVVSSDVGNAFEAQGNMNTKLVILPANERSVELVDRWLEGESRLVSKVNFGEYPEQSYFNYVLVPTTAGKFHIHAMNAAEASNFITAEAGEQGFFPGTLLVTASYCGDTNDKEKFLQHVLETKHRAEASLGIGPPTDTDGSSILGHLSTSTDFDHDGAPDAVDFPHPELRCDHVKRRLVAQRRYEITPDRHIVWT